MTVEEKVETPVLLESILKFLVRWVHTIERTKDNALVRTQLSHYPTPSRVEVITHTPSLWVFPD